MCVHVGVCVSENQIFSEDRPLFDIYIIIIREQINPRIRYRKYSYSQI